MPKQVAPRRSQVRKDRHNKQVEDEVIDDNTFLFGRVIKPLGNCYFEIAYVDDKKILQPKAIARVRSANCARILINDLIAILPDGSSLEIRGKISNSSMRTLIKERRLHKDLVATATATEEEEGGFVIAEEDEVDVDTI
jgi:hypothetical protein